MDRRKFLKASAAALAATAGSGWFLNSNWAKWFPKRESLSVNDIHSKLNAAHVTRIEHPRSLEDLISLVRRSGRERRPMAVCGARHAMGGQQFLDGEMLVDTRRMNGVLDLDTQRGIVEVEAGIDWPTLVNELHQRQTADAQPWTIRSKQTGADKLTLGGALAANVHGRTLKAPPLISDVESLLLVGADGEVRRCSRTENPDLFKLVIGGYGLFGIVHSVQLRLSRREKIQRLVEVIPIADAQKRFQERIRDGFVFGDFQYVTDEKSPDFLSKGVFSCYRPVSQSTPIPENQKSVSERQWTELVYLAHTDKARAFKLYSDFYLKSSGQVYWSDTAQLGPYPNDYHLTLDRRTRSSHPGTEMITEVYVPLDRLEDFMIEAASELRRQKASVIYGTVRLIEQDEESFLAWAKQRFACVIFNLHIEHEKAKISAAEGAFRTLIDLASERGGSYYLTYHRWASREQVLRCYPQFPGFLSAKLHHDPKEVFQSDWYRHNKAMFAADPVDKMPT